jgi:hypothetical protein
VFQAQIANGIGVDNDSAHEACRKEHAQHDHAQKPAIADAPAHNDLYNG